MEDIHEDSFQFAPLGFGGMSSAFIDNNCISSHYMMAGGSNTGTNLTPLPTSQWLHCQQSRQYIEFLPETSCVEFHNEIPNATFIEPASLEQANFPHMEGYLLPHDKETSKENFTGVECQLSHEQQDCNRDYNHVSQAYVESGAARSQYPSEAHQAILKQKADNTDRKRRLTTAGSLDALRELIPHAKQGGKAALLDAVIEHIKSLQLQVKDLSQNRLGGESNPCPLIYLEGHGHFMAHDQMLHQPIEETMGKLLKDNPSVAAELLQHKGLFVMPIAVSEALRETK